MSDAESLQFERAEFDQTPGQAQCAECHRPLTNSYFEVNGHMVCEACRYTLESRLTAGSPVGRFAKAAGAGTAAAVAGAILWYAIATLTGYELGLIAIVVGFGVGAAVRWGSNNRGGWKYQTLAIALTYLAIVSTYIPPILEELRNASAAQSQAIDGQGEPQDASGSTPPAAAPNGSPADASSEPPMFGGFVFAVVVIFAIACAAPFLAGFENIIGIVIIGIGLYEAWKINKRTEVTITGPHALARPPQAAAGV
jgi:hypothetical protein